MRFKLTLFVMACALLLASPNLFAQEEDFGDFGDFDLGMDTPEVIVDESKIKAAGPSGPWSVTGFIKEEVGYSFAKDDPYLSKARTTLNLTMEYKPGGSWRAKMSYKYFYDPSYMSNDTPTPTQAMIDSMVEESEIKDFYIDAQLAEGLELRIGRQVMAWGQSQVSQLNDMANPRDSRELGMVDIEDARLPVTAAKLFWQVAEGQGLDLVVISEFRPNKMAASGSEFDMLGSLAAMGLGLYDETAPDFQAEYLARYQIQMNGGDLSFFASQTYSDSAHLVFSDFDGSNLNFNREYGRVNSVGFSANRTVDTWMFRGEVAAKQNVWQMRNPTGWAAEFAGTSTVVGAVQKDVLQAALAVEYSGFMDLMLTGELAVDQIQDYVEGDLFSDEMSLVGTFSLSHDSLNDQWNNRIFWFRFFPNEGDTIRWDSTYNTDTEGLSVAGGMIIYQDHGADSFMAPFTNNDRIYSSVKYYF